MTKKYKVEVSIMKSQSVWYEVEAKDKESIKKMIDNGSLEDYGVAINETIPEEVSSEYLSIVED